MNTTQDSTHQITRLKRAEIQPNPWNRKTFNEDKLAELAASIQAQGIIQPLIVRALPPVPGVAMKFPAYELIAGERRWRAAELAQVEELPCIVREVDDRGVMELMAIENLQREDLTALEEAQNYRQLIDDCGCKVEDLEERLGRKRSAIYARLRLLTLPASVKKALGDGKIEPSVADLIATIPEDKQREAALKEVLSYTEWDQEKGERVPATMSFRDAKDRIEEEFRKSLKGALFDLKKDGLAGEVACHVCPLRTGNIEGLPAGSNPNICTAPACYARKVAAHQSGLLADLKAKGKTVLEGKDAPKWQYGSLAYNSGYVLAEGTRYDHDSGKHKPYAKLLGKQMPEILHMVNPAGEVVQVCRQKDMEAALVAAGIVKPEKKEKAETPAAKAKRELEEKVEPLVDAEIVTRLLEDPAALAANATAKDVVLWLLGVMDNIDMINHEVMMRRRQWDNNGGHFLDHAKKLTGVERFALLVECFLVDDAYADGYDETAINGLVKALGVKVDRAGIAKRIRAELEAKAKDESAKHANDAKAETGEVPMNKLPMHNGPAKAAKVKTPKPAKAAKPAKPVKTKKASKAKK